MPEKNRHKVVPDGKMNDAVRSSESKSASKLDIDRLIDVEPKAQSEGFQMSKIEEAVKSTNIPMILMIIGMLVFGLIVLYSVSAPDAYGQFNDSGWFFVRQLRYTIVGLIMMLIIAFMPISFFERKWVGVVAYVFSIGFSLATIILGVGRENGAVRWINIGPIQFQSSEFIKVALVIFFAGYRSSIEKLKKAGKIKKAKSDLGKLLINTSVDFIIPVCLCILVDFIIILQPHLSCFIIIAAIIFMCALVSEIPLKSWVTGSIIMLLVGGAAGALVLALAPDIRSKVESRYAHVFKRIAIYSADEDDIGEEEGDLTKDDTRQVDNAHNALGSGGMWGVGIGNSRSKYNYVSEAQNDYIFSIYIEETGFVGGVFLVLMYMVMFFMCLRVCWRAKDLFSRTVATGCTALIFVEMLMNLSVELQIIPATGVTLPFISCGGTAQVSLLIAYGLILSVSRTGTVRAPKKRASISSKNVRSGV